MTIFGIILVCAMSWLLIIGIADKSTPKTPGMVSVLWILFLLIIGILVFGTGHLF